MTRTATPNRCLNSLSRNGTTGRLPPIDPDAITSRPPRRKVNLRGVEFNVIGERVQYLAGNGQLVTESIQDYSRKGILSEYRTLNEFMKHWMDADRKQAIVDELETRGVFFEDLQDLVGRDVGPFDLICHVAVGQPPLTRRERADNERKRDYFIEFGEQARAVMQALLDKYADEGIGGVADHVHLLVGLKPTLCISDFMRELKNHHPHGS